MLREVPKESHFGKNLIFVLLLVGVIFAGIYFYYFYYLNDSKMGLLTCSDGTFDGQCSLNKPYYCLESKLVENVPGCGCPNSSSFSEGSCVSEYYFGEEVKTFNYIFDGEERKFEFLVYPKVVEYLKILPRSRLYSDGEFPRRDDFILMKINDPVQRDFLIPLVVRIQNTFPNSLDLQTKMAVRIVQSIPYNESGFEYVERFERDIPLSRYPYEVISEFQGSCEGKSELLVFLLRELGMGVVIFDYDLESHEAVGVKCPMENSFLGTGYCFIETTMFSPISFSEGRYDGLSGQGKLSTKPKVILIHNGFSLSEDFDEYEDSEDLSSLINKIDEKGVLNYFDKKRMDELRKKYSLVY